MPIARDTIEVEALVTDRYLESLLAARAFAGEGPTPADAAFGWGGGELDRGVRAASLRLRRDLPRFHPSFRFEERLALRLAEASASMRMARAAGAESGPVPLAARAGAHATHDPDLDELVALSAGTGDGPGAGDEAGHEADPLRRHARPILIGGAVAPAAVTLAGAAFVAWRRSHQPRSPMARAARAAHAARAAQPADGRPD